MSLFEEEEEKRIVKKLHTKHKVEPEALPSDIENTWLVVSGVSYFIKIENLPCC
jgi:hypothetical protein